MSFVTAERPALLAPLSARVAAASADNIAMRRLYMHRQCTWNNQKKSRAALLGHCSRRQPSNHALGGVKSLYAPSPGTATAVCSASANVMPSTRSYRTACEAQKDLWVSRARGDRTSGLAHVHEKQSALRRAARASRKNGRRPHGGASAAAHSGLQPRQQQERAAAAWPSGLPEASQRCVRGQRRGTRGRGRRR